jgi:hypothetical protein
LAEQIDPVLKYVNSKQASTTQPIEDRTGPLPGDDWWKRPEFASAAAALKEWGLTIGHIQASEVLPGTTDDDLRKVYRMLLFEAAFTKRLYAAPYPFVDAPRPEISEARFKQGEKFFYEMQCLKCHVLGDPTAPGANTQPTAPNLGLAYRRLQHRWVRDWVQEPYIIQVRTAMPSFFTGRPVFKLEGQSWAHAQPAGDPAQQPAHVRRIESEYGTTADEQASLLLDFLYAAGVRGYTGIQPAATTQPAAPAASAN